MFQAILESGVRPSQKIYEIVQFVCLNANCSRFLISMMIEMKKIVDIHCEFPSTKEFAWVPIEVPLDAFLGAVNNHLYDEGKLIARDQYQDLMKRSSAALCEIVEEQGVELSQAYFYICATICISPLSYHELMQCGVDDISQDTSDLWSSAILAYSGAFEISNAFEIIRMMEEQGLQIDLEAELRAISAAAVIPVSMHLALQRIDNGCRSGRFLCEELGLILSLILESKKSIDVNSWKRILNVCLQSGMQLSSEVQELNLAAALKCRNLTFCTETISILEMGGKSVDPKIKEFVSLELRQHDSVKELYHDLDDDRDGRAKKDADHLISLIGSSMKNGR
eukprot:361084-Hanusia_phi.AAC.1